MYLGKKPVSPALQTSIEGNLNNAISMLK